MKKKGPDSLEGLLIAGVACLISTLMFGTIELSSLLFVACIDRYATNRNQASFPFMLSNVLQAMTGPLAGYLAQRFSVRFVVFVGSILSFVGVAGCYFAEDILVVTILWGIVFGTGLGFATLLLPVVINDYFIEQRSKALGVCYVGSPIGFFIFPSVFEILVERYGLSGSFLFLAGINMHCIPLAMLLRRPHFAQKSIVDSKPDDPRPDCKDSEKNQLPCVRSGTWPSRSGGTNRRAVAKCPGPDIVFKHHEYEQFGKVFHPRVSEQFSEIERISISREVPSNRLGTGAPDKTEIPNDHNKCSDKVTAKYLGTSALDKTHIQNDYSDKLIAKSGNILGTGALDKTKIPNDHECSDKVIAKYLGTSALDKTQNGTMSKDNIQNGHNRRDKLIAKFGKSDYDSLNPPPGTPILLNYMETNGRQNGDLETPDENRSHRSPRKSMLDLYSDPVFLLICLINGLTNLNFGTLSTVIVDFGRDHGTLPDHDKYIMMCISVTGVVGMLGFGWVTDGGHMTRTGWASLTLVIGSACIFAMPETFGFALLIVPLSIFCVCQSSFFPLIPAITAEYIREEFQEMAISACNVLSGPMYFVIPPLIGHFRDGKGSYDNIFYFMAGLSIVNSVSVFVIPYVARWRDKKETM